MGCTVRFRYDDIEGSIKLVKQLPGDIVVVEYMGEMHEFSKKKLQNVPFGVMLGRIHKDWVYSEGDMIKNNDRNISATVVTKYHKTTKSSKNGRFYTLRCGKCNQLYDRFENDVVETGCPVCANWTVIRGVNDLWRTHKHIASQLDDPEDGYKYSYGKRVFLNWRCQSCGKHVNHLTPMQVINFVDERVICENCADWYSFPNKFFNNLLSEMKIDFVPEKSFSWSCGKRYDFYFPDLNMIVELHGGQHYDKRFPEIRKNDDFKKKLAMSNGIEYYYEIECKKSKADYVFTSVQKALSGWFDFSGVDIAEISFMSQRTIFDRTIDALCKNDFDITKTAKQMGIHWTTVSEYLKIAKDRGRFSPEEVAEKQLRNKERVHYQSDGRPIMNEDTGEVFGNYTQVKKYFADQGRNISKGSLISGIQRGGKPYGFSWKYISREEFNQIKKDSPSIAYGDYFDEE